MENLSLMNLLKPTKINQIILISLGVISTPFAAFAESADDETVELSTLKISAQGEGEREANPSEEYVGSNATSVTGLSASVKETPQMVNVVTEKRMQDQQLSTVNDVLMQTPGVSVKEYDSSRQYYFARGFEITNMMIDGSQILFDPGWGTGEQNASTAMYEQVEVIKGATGLTSGSGNPSAAINLVRKRADQIEFEGSASVSVGNRSQLKSGLDVQGALSDTGHVRGRLVVDVEQEDSFRSVGDTSSQLVYGTTEIDLNDSTLLTLGGSIQSVDNNGTTWGGLPLWYDDGTRTDWDRSKTTAADWTYWNSDFQSLFAELKHQLNDDWTLNLNANYGTSKGNSQLLYVLGNSNRDTGLGISPWAGGKFDLDSEYTMVDAFAHGSFNLFDRDHEVRVGVSRAEREFTATQYAVTSTTPIGDFNAWDGTSYPEFVYGDSSLYESVKETQTALYASTKLNLTDAFKVIAGTRVTSFELDIAPGGLSISAGDSIEHNNIVTPYLGALYDLTESVTAYASYTDIFNSQGERDSTGATLDPVEGASMELGVKAGFMDDRLIASAALFDIEQDNLAQADTGQVVPGTTDQAYVAADGASSQGYELELVGAIRAGWDVQLGWTQYKAEDAQGNKVNTDQPRRQLKAYTSYQLPNDLHQWTLGGGFAWESESYATATNPITSASEEVKQESYTLVNLMAKYAATPNLTLQVNVDNLTDKTYYTNIGTFGQYAYGTPRTVSVSGLYQF